MNGNVLSGLDLSCTVCFHWAVMDDIEEFVSFVDAHDQLHLLPVTTKRIMPTCIRNCIGKTP